LKAQKSWYEAQKAQSASLLPVYNEQYQALATLYKKQLTSKDSVLEMQKKLTEARYTLEGASAKLTEMDVSYRQAETEYRARIAEKMQQAEQEVSDKQHENSVLEKQQLELKAQTVVRRLTLHRNYCVSFPKMKVSKQRRWSATVTSDFYNQGRR